MRGIGAASVTAVALLAGTSSRVAPGAVSLDYWAQLSPWVERPRRWVRVLAGTLVFVYWRLAERSHSYLRFARVRSATRPSPLAARGARSSSGRAPFVEVVDLPRRVMRCAVRPRCVGIALIGLDNRGVALLREAPVAARSVEHATTASRRDRRRREDQAHAGGCSSGRA